VKTQVFWISLTILVAAEKPKMGQRGEQGCPGGHGPQPLVEATGTGIGAGLPEPRGTQSLHRSEVQTDLSASGREQSLSSVTDLLGATDGWWPYYPSAPPSARANWVPFEQLPALSGAEAATLFIKSASEPAATDVIRVWYERLCVLNGLDGAGTTTSPPTLKTSSSPAPSATSPRSASWKSPPPAGASPASSKNGASPAFTTLNRDFRPTPNDKPPNTPACTRYQPSIDGMRVVIADGEAFGPYSKLD
jgi:hypothetical protein